MKRAAKAAISVAPQTHRGSRVSQTVRNTKPSVEHRASKHQVLDAPKPSHLPDSKEARSELEKPEIEAPQKLRIEALHLFRALLREASYLPDPASRKFFRAHITSRYRDYCPRKPKMHLKPKKEDPVPENTRPEDLQKMAQNHKRNTHMLSVGRKDLSFLQRANTGAPTPLTKVLEMTYGRRGKRKHDLLKDLAPSERTPPDDNALRKLCEALDTPSKEQASTPNMSLFSDRFVALVKSQMKQKAILYTKLLPRSSAPKIPEKNLWGRPLPVARVKNLTKRWYAETLDRLMAPLPETEWMHLRDLAIGTIKWPGQPKRRAKGIGEWRDDLGIVGSRSQTAEVKTRVETARGRQAHELTPRYMRRMWAGVFAQCPLMKWNGIKGRWTFEWGRVDEARGIVLSMDSPFSEAGFEGVDEAGEVLGNEVDG